jgi:1-acyl-sn-glycerol-3-phosphate acyltransferase
VANRSLAKRLFYRGMRRLVRTSSRWMFSSIEIRGMDRIPTDTACIVSPNHVSAFLDALLVGAFAPTDMRYLSRSSAFGTRWDWFLEALQMVPIYRRRDGFETLSRNWEIFQQQSEALGEGNALLIFSEAEHALTYHLRPLSRGSSRFALETRAAIDDEVLLVPVGINYYHLMRPGFKVSVIVGEPIPVSTYDAQYAEDEARCINALRSDLAEGMKECLLLPNKTDEHHRRLDFINRKNEHLSFPAMKRALADLNTSTAESAEPNLDDLTHLAPKGPYRPGLDRLSRWVDVLNAPPVWGMQRMMSWVQDPAFAASLKFATGMLVLPVWWGLLAGIGWAAHSLTAGLVLAVTAVGTVLLRRALIRRADPPHEVEA